MEQNAAARPFLPWVGGKERLQYIIRSIFPPRCTKYAEHCGGSGAILLGQPRVAGRVEVYNDCDADLTNLFLCVRDRPMALLRELGFFPLHSEVEFELLLRLLRREMPAPDFTGDELAVAEFCLTPEQSRRVRTVLEGRAELWDVRRAAAFYSVTRRSFNSMRKTFALRPTNVENFLRLIVSASRRLQDVVITNRDFEKSICLHDAPGVTHYCDPPYFDAEKMYAPVFSLDDHVRLHDRLRTCRGNVVVSYNHCDYIRELYADFYQMRFDRVNSMSSHKNAVYEEMLLTNYDPRPMLETRMKQYNMFAPEQEEQGELVLIHEPCRLNSVAMPESKETFGGKHEKIYQEHHQEEAGHSL